MKMSWGTGIAVVYTTFALGTVGFVAFASMQNHDLVRNDYYEDALKRNGSQEAESNAAELPVGLVCAGNELNVGLSRRFPDVPLDITLYRPSSASSDVVIHTRTDTNGVAVVDLRSFAQGRWNVRVDWQAGKRYRMAKYIYLGESR